MATAVPWWLRGIVSLDRGFSKAQALEALVRDELAWGLTPPEARAAVTAALYAAQGTYAPRGALYARGLFPWEEELLALDAFAPPGALLLGGAGGGRELGPLRARGWTVRAFEPCEALCARAREACEGDPGARVERGAYDDLVRFQRQGDGPLRGLLEGSPFDAVVLGWGSLSHVCERDARVALLRAARGVCPRGPVLLSFLPRTAEAAEGRSVRWLRGACRALGAPSERAPGGTFLWNAGFAVRLSVEDVRAEAREAGYRVLRAGLSPYGHAALTPEP
ncbi:MAG: hypothetical protein HY909_30025 [Deltaproteobacteria bacterium]|nr:hypothetical protein [Deltaproteobacteria bacterium]